jgi:hypothetical protein
VTVWCGVANFRVIGPYYLEDEDGHTITATSVRCVEMLRNYLTPELSCRGTELSTIWLLQDGATAHTRASMVVVHCTASLHGLHVLLTSLPVIIPFGGTSERKCEPLDH